MCLARDRWLFIGQFELGKLHGGKLVDQSKLQILIEMVMLLFNSNSSRSSATIRILRLTNAMPIGVVFEVEILGGTCPTRHTL